MTYMHTNTVNKLTFPIYIHDSSFIHRRDAIFPISFFVFCFKISYFLVILLLNKSDFLISTQYPVYHYCVNSRLIKNRYKIRAVF